jgi:hypothetical protein
MKYEVKLLFVFNGSKGVDVLKEGFHASVVGLVMVNNTSKRGLPTCKSRPKWRE